MENEFSLVKLLQNDPDFSAAFKKRTEDTKKDKQNLLKAATEYTQKYSAEIDEGTKKRQKLLGEGLESGLTEEEIFKDNSTFYPTKYTPILNFLYFTIRDEKLDNDNNKTIQEIIEEYISQFGYSKSEFIDLYIKGISEELPRGFDDKEVSFDDVITEENTNEPEDIGKFIYGNLTTAEFKKLKKLKALSKSSNESEAFSAYRKCLELCKRFGLDFDKIPCELR